MYVHRGKFGREENALLCVHKSGALSVKVRFQIIRNARI